MASEFIPAFPITHDFHKLIYWDRHVKQYYNKTTDIYLSEDDVKFYHLTLPRENAEIGVLYGLKLYILPQNVNNIENCLRDQHDLCKMKFNFFSIFFYFANKTYMINEWLKGYPRYEHFCSINSFFNLDQYL